MVEEKGNALTSLRPYTPLQKEKEARVKIKLAREKINPAAKDVVVAKANTTITLQTKLTEMLTRFVIFATRRDTSKEIALTAINYRIAMAT